MSTFFKQPKKYDPAASERVPDLLAEAKEVLTKLDQAATVLIQSIEKKADTPPEYKANYGLIQTKISETASKVSQLEEALTSVNEAQKPSHEK